jgi:hypothetical protein
MIISFDHLTCRNLYPSVIPPQGHLYLKQFQLDPFPSFTYVCPIYH